MDRSNKIQKTEEEWKKELTPEEYRILREKGTEPAFSGEYYKSKEVGTYLCRACGQELFSSDTKFDSGSGWPSFYEPIHPEKIQMNPDQSFEMTRTEVICSRCGSHLGHVFDDLPASLRQPAQDTAFLAGEALQAGGPQPTGKRFCINSLSLKFNLDDPVK